MIQLDSSSYSWMSNIEALIQDDVNSFCFIFCIFIRSPINNNNKSAWQTLLVYSCSTPFLSSACWRYTAPPPPPARELSVRVCVCACWSPTSSDLVGLLRRNKNPSGTLGLDLVSPCTLTCPGCGGGRKRNNNDHQKREIRSKKNPLLKTCLFLSALWDRYRQNMHMDERVRGERKIRIWFLGKSTSETKKLGGKRKRRIVGSWK